MEEDKNNQIDPVHECDSDNCQGEAAVHSDGNDENDIFHECNAADDESSLPSDENENLTSKNEENLEKLQIEQTEGIRSGEIERVKELAPNSSADINIKDMSNAGPDEQQCMDLEKRVSTHNGNCIVIDKDCDVCKESSIFIKSTSFCLVCEEYYCNDCTNIHRSQKATKCHTYGQPKQNDAIFKCETCNVRGIQVPAEASCGECKELYCSQCADVHRRQKATKSHSISKHECLSEKRKCEPCGNSGQTDKAASFLCICCDEVFCNNCSCVHSRQKATKTHTILASDENTCHECRNKGTKMRPEMFCRACMFYLCKNCANAHRNNSATNDHKMNYLPDNQVNETPSINTTLYVEEKAMVKDQQGNNLHRNDKETKPGVPTVVGEIKIDSVNLTWDPPRTLFEGHCYQLRYKEDVPNSKWLVYPECIQKTTFVLNNLMSDTTYIFQVRMVGEDKESPYSDPSDPVKTVQSAATRLMDFMFDVTIPDVDITLKKTPLHENKSARDEPNRTRKLVVGTLKKTNCHERTILLVGATGSGKSTLVDGMINYIFGVHWNDPYRLTVIDFENDELQRNSNQAHSQTQWITCYTIHPMLGSRLDYTLNIIDTPGFGDTRGIERDKEIVNQIRTLFSKDDESGVVFIDAVCFLIKAPDARLTPTQMYIFNAIMSLFGQDIANNFCMLVTFADGKRPPVLSALKEAGLPHDHHFPFNNSGLFADNCGENVCNFSSMFWGMGCASFNMFFQKLDTLETKSLLQTRDVLQQREKIELTVENLLPKVDAGLHMVEELRVEIRILEDNKTQIEANSDFTYEVSETEQRQIDLPVGKHVTNCLNCNSTCHKDCKIPNDDGKKHCIAMDGETGNCTQCVKGCVWSMHRNTPYIFEYITVKKQKTYTEKLEKYRLAKDKNMTRQKVVNRMQDELFKTEYDILQQMQTINACNNTLREIALRPDPLSLVEHIDLLLESEKQEKRQGFQARISSLHQCRKKATIEDDVERFTSSFTDTRIFTGRVVTIASQKEGKKRNKRGIVQKVVNYVQEELFK